MSLTKLSKLKNISWSNVCENLTKTLEETEILQETDF